MLSPTIGRMIQNHPLSIAFDVALLIAMMSGAFMLALQYDIILDWHPDIASDPHINLHEAFGLAGLLGFGICAFIWRRIREEQRDNERWRKAEAELREHRRLATLDPLTALPNRREFLAALEAAIAPGSRRSHAVFVLDLNGFKRVNDENGHAAGDEVLRAVALRFLAEARQEDLLARLGGDEFAILALGIGSQSEAAEIGERFIAALNNDLHVGGHAYSVGVAVGVAFYPQDGVSAQEIMHNADLAMYSAKAMKSSALRFFQPNTCRESGARVVHF